MTSEAVGAARAASETLHRASKQRACRLPCSRERRCRPIAKPKRVGQFRLGMVHHQRALIVRKGLIHIAHVLPQFSQCGQCARVVGRYSQCGRQVFLRGAAIAKFFKQPCNFNLRRRKCRVLRGPIFEHGKRFFRTALLDEQHRQPAPAFNVIRIAVEALPIITFRLRKVGGNLLCFALAMVVRRQVVITIRVVGLGLNGLTESLGRGVVIALLKHAHAFRVLPSRHPSAAAGSANDQAGQ